MNSAWESELEEKAKSLMTTLAESAEEFALEISTRGDTLGTFGDEAVLHKICHSTFVDGWLAIPRKEWRLVKQALEWRHANGRRFPEEREWILLVNGELAKRAEILGGMEGLRLRRLIPNIAAGAQVE